MKEATARIKINKQLEASGWRFFPGAHGPANICLEHGTKIKETDLNALGEDFEKTTKGYIDFLLLNAKGFPFIVLEAKSEGKDPLDGKEQARKYARAQNCRFIILSNGNLHYFWDLERGSPYIVTSLPSPTSVMGYEKAGVPDPKRLTEEPVRADYIALSQRPTYASEAGWINVAERPEYIKSNKLRFLRAYQEKAVHAVQRAVKDGNDRFLFEMAIVQRGPRNVGKSSTIRLLYDKLRAAYPSSTIECEVRTEKDIRAIFVINGVRIGIESLGDPSMKRLGDSLTLFVERKCDAIVCACRTYGETTQRVEMLKDHEFQPIWRERVRETEEAARAKANQEEADWLFATIQALIDS